MTKVNVTFADDGVTSDGLHYQITGQITFSTTATSGTLVFNDVGKSSGIRYDMGGLFRFDVGPIAGSPPVWSGVPSSFSFTNGIANTVSYGQYVSNQGTSVGVGFPASVTVSSSAKSLVYSGANALGTTQAYIVETNVNGSTASTTFSVVIGLGNNPPNWQNVFFSVPQGGTYNLNSQCTDPDLGDTITYAPLLALPQGITLNSVSGLITVSSTVSTGAYSARFRATDSANHIADSNNLTLSVTGPSQTFSVSDITFARNTASVTSISVPGANASTRVVVDFGYVGGVTADLNTLQLNYDASSGDPLKNANWSINNAGASTDAMSGDLTRPARLVAYDVTQPSGLRVYFPNHTQIPGFTGDFLNNGLQSAYNAIVSNGGQGIIELNPNTPMVDVFPQGRARLVFTGAHNITLQSQTVSTKARIWANGVNSQGMIQLFNGAVFNMIDIDLSPGASPNAGRAPGASQAYFAALNALPSTASTNVTRCWIHHGANGFGSGNNITAPVGWFNFVDTVFGDNGPDALNNASGGGYGQTHHTYMGQLSRFASFTGCTFLECDGGHLSKGRSIETRYLGCVFLSAHSCYASAQENAAINIDEMKDQQVPGIGPHQVIGCLIVKRWPPNPHIYGPSSSVVWQDLNNGIALHGHMLQLNAEPTTANGGIDNGGIVRLQFYNNIIYNEFTTALQSSKAGCFLNNGTQWPAGSSIDVRDCIYMGPNTPGSLNGVNISSQGFISDAALFSTSSLMLTTTSANTFFPNRNNGFDDFRPSSSFAASAVRSINRPRWPLAPYGSDVVNQGNKGCY